MEGSSSLDHFFDLRHGDEEGAGYPIDRFAGLSVEKLICRERNSGQTLYQTRKGTAETCRLPIKLRLFRVESRDKLFLYLFLRKSHHGTLY
jgi:hypothetical protein